MNFPTCLDSTVLERWQNHCFGTILALLIAVTASPGSSVTQLSQPCKAACSVSEMLELLTADSQAFFFFPQSKSLTTGDVDIDYLL